MRATMVSPLLHQAISPHQSQRALCLPVLLPWTPGALLPGTPSLTHGLQLCQLLSPSPQQNIGEACGECLLLSGPHSMIFKSLHDIPAASPTLCYPILLSPPGVPSHFRLGHSAQCCAFHFVQAVPPFPGLLSLFLQIRLGCHLQKLSHALSSSIHVAMTKYHQGLVHKQQKLLSHGSGGEEGQAQGAGQFPVWRRPAAPAHVLISGGGEHSVPHLLCRH